MLGNALVIATREMGTLPISVPTALAFEALALEKGVNEEVIFINVRTLYRNMRGSLPADVRKNIPIEDFVNPILEEMTFIREYLSTIHYGGLSVVYYISTYDDLSRKLPHAVMKEAKTELAKAHLKDETLMMNYLLEPDLDHGIIHFKTQMESGGKKGILLSHSPVDLLFNDFISLRLLESYTGALKKRGAWNTKLTAGKHLPNMPFNKFTVQVFGDNNTLLSMMPKSIRAEVIAMAEQDNWHTLSTRERIVASISKMKDHYARQFLMKVLRS